MGLPGGDKEVIHMRRLGTHIVMSTTLLPLPLLLLFLNP